MKHLLVTILILIIIGFSLFFGYLDFLSNEKTIEINGVTRRYRIHKPQNYSSGKSHPLIIALHGIEDNARIFELYSFLSVQSDESGYIIVYPYGSSQRKYFSPLTWNSGICCGYAHEQNIDDVAFISNLIDSLQKNYRVDPSKVYLAGYSTGGMLAYRAGLALSDRISGVAVVNSSVGVKDFSEDSYKFLEKTYAPVPVQIFHGKEDKSVPFDSGQGKGSAYEFPGAYDSVNFWLENNGCSKNPSEIVRKEDYTKELFSDCKGNAAVEFYSVAGKHVWPGGLFDPIKFFNKSALKASREMINFFYRHGGL